MISRQDISLPAQAVQSGHALYEASQLFYSKKDNHPHFVFTHVKDERELFYWLSKLERHDIRHISWREPDMFNELTAIVTEPVYGEDRRFFKKLKLMREKNE